jgi:ABC-type multidrug transport system fused ATPase/permease subunit
VQQAMSELGKKHSIITIAHRLSTVRNADKILVFEKGSIVQEGTYDSLAKTPGLFERLLRDGEN